MFIAGHKIIVVVAHFIVIIHGSKLKHLLKTVPNHAFCLCLQTCKCTLIICQQEALLEQDI